MFGVGVAIFDTLIYGGPLRSGYRPGEITCSLSATGQAGEAECEHDPSHPFRLLSITTRLEILRAATVRTLSELG